MPRYDNAPDDNATYLRTCPAGHRWHASEGGCGKCDANREQVAAEPCPYCENEFEDSDFEYDSWDDGTWVATCKKCHKEVWR